MITYTVKFKKGFFWKKIKNVKGDGLTESGKSRFFILDSEERIEVDTNNTIFIFSKERFYLIQERMSQEARQDVKVNPR